MVNVHEYVTLDREGDSFSGTFTVDATRSRRRHSFRLRITADQ
jgi:hypothetical protein